MPQRGGLFEAEVARAARESRFVVVDFGAPWCGPCKVMERTTWTDSRVRRWIDANAIRVHIDIEQRSDVKNRFAVGGVPTTVVLWNGREVGRTSGALGGEAMVEWLRSTTRRS
ncbi:MAG TPA: thioredoxin family protein [Phycisphaerales bacterium]|nr:thioredoxin family protein [Phycisphaerales bacterium]HMP38468.1 thioredoxin family protein [Phycisphaerales bacterium]